MRTPLAALAGQRQRKRAYLDAVRTANCPRFSADGAWLAGDMEPHFRERLWHCLAFLAGDERHVELANRILETSTGAGGDFDVFFSLWLLRSFEARLSRAARAVLIRAARDGLSHVEEHLFRYTENCAALNAFALLEASRRWGAARYAARAREWVECLAEERRRSGTSREFISVNYLPVFLTGISLIARHAEDRGLRSLAAGIEERIWMELAACWHPHLKSTAGPSGRSYTYDSMAVYGALHGLVWAVLGGRACPSPMDAGLFAPPPACPVEPRRVAFCQSGGAAWFASVEHRMSQPTAALFYRKRYPFAMEASVRLPGWRHHDLAAPGTDAKRLGGWVSGDRAFVPGTLFHPGGLALITAYLARDYGVGASSRMLYGQTDFCFGIWGRRTSAAAPMANRTAFTRYVINDALEAHFGRRDCSGLLQEEGRGGCLQSGPLAVAWYAGGEPTTRRIRKLRTCLLLPVVQRDLDEVWIGTRRCRGLAGASVKEDWVFVRDGATYLGVRPLALTNHGRKTAVEVRRTGCFRTIVFYNYDGRARDFPPAVLRQTCGGLVFCIGSQREWRSFTRFRASCRRVEMYDALYESQRRIRCQWGRRTIDLLWDMQTEELLTARRDGALIDWPVLRLSASPH